MDSRLSVPAPLAYIAAATGLVIFGLCARRNQSQKIDGYAEFLITNGIVSKAQFFSYSTRERRILNNFGVCNLLLKQPTFLNDALALRPEQVDVLNLPNVFNLVLNSKDYLEQVLDMDFAQAKLLNQHKNVCRLICDGFVSLVWVLSLTKEQMSVLNMDSVIHAISTNKLSPETAITLVPELVEVPTEDLIKHHDHGNLSLS